MSMSRIPLSRQMPLRSRGLAEVLTVKSHPGHGLYAIIDTLGFPAGQVATGDPVPGMHPAQRRRGRGHQSLGLRGIWALVA